MVAAARSRCLPKVFRGTGRGRRSEVGGQRSELPRAAYCRAPRRRMDRSAGDVVIRSTWLIETGILDAYEPQDSSEKDPEARDSASGGSSQTGQVEAQAGGVGKGQGAKSEKKICGA